MENKLLSVIVPVYKVEQYLERCVDSIIAQTYRPLEIILVDDGSPDNSGRICDKLAERYPEVSSFHKQNGGVSSARNYGIEKAKGEFITYVDSDDYLADNKTYEYCIPHFENEDVDIVQFPILIIKGGNEECAELCYCPDTDFITLSDKESIITQFSSVHSYEAGLLSSSLWNKIFRFRRIKSIPFRFSVAEDEDFMIKAFDSVNSIVVESNGRYAYLMRENSITTTKWRAAEWDNVSTALVNTYDYLCKNAPNSEFILSMYLRLMAVLISAKLEFKFNYLEHHRARIHIPRIASGNSLYLKLRLILMRILGLKNYIDFVCFIGSQLKRKK